MVGSVLGIFGEQVAKHGTATSSAKISVQQIRIFTITSSCASIQTENSAPATPVPKYDTHVPAIGREFLQPQDRHYGRSSASPDSVNSPLVR